MSLPPREARKREARWKHGGSQSREGAAGDKSLRTPRRRGGSQQAGLRCSFGQREPADQLLCRDPESQAPWAGAGLPGPSRPSSPGPGSVLAPTFIFPYLAGWGPQDTVTHLHPPVWCWGLLWGCGDSGRGRLLGPRQALTATAATGVVSDQYLLWGLALVAPLSPWHERWPDSSHGLQGSFLTWQPHLWPLEMQALNCCSLDFPGFPEPLCFSTCLSLCL